MLLLSTHNHHIATVDVTHALSINHPPPTHFPNWASRRQFPVRNSHTLTSAPPDEEEMHPLTRMIINWNLRLCCQSAGPTSERTANEKCAKWETKQTITTANIIIAQPVSHCQYGSATALYPMGWCGALTASQQHYPLRLQSSSRLDAVLGPHGDYFWWRKLYFFTYPGNISHDLIWK